MTLAKAIEILTLEQRDPGSQNPADFKDAIVIGLDAIKRIQWNRNHPYYQAHKALPHEDSK